MTEEVKNQNIATNNDLTRHSQPFYTLPLRDVVLFPNMTTTIIVGREKSVNGIEESKRLNVPIFVVAQTNPDHDEFDQKNIYQVGCLCSILGFTKLSDGSLKVIAQGLIRANLQKIVPSDKFFISLADILVDEKYEPEDNKKLLGLIKSCIEDFGKYAEYNKKITPEVMSSLTKVRSPHDIAYLIMTYINSSVKNKQQILEENNIEARLYKTLEVIKTELEILKTEIKINKTIQEKITKTQKDFYLHEQLKQIKKELGQDEENEVEEIKKKVKELILPKEVLEKCKSEIAKLEKMNPYSSESGVVRNYLDWIVSLPWNIPTKPNTNFAKAEAILNKNHYGLNKIKDRVLEFIAVQMKKKNSKGPILCFVGAPGVGKTSLAKSIADALNRKYVKVSLGGVRDESEIRGHRRTYIGSMPGRILQSMKKAKSTNPLMLLDEIDKMSYDLRGDPASALLEVLDPEQNSNFSDHYLEVDYDLSKVMFVATANNIAGIPIPLRDRMEIIKLSGYTENEKLHIAKEHLISKQKEESGLKEDEFTITDDALLELVRKYTFEAGVRNLNREIGTLTRKSTKEIVMKKQKSLQITKNDLSKFLGPEKFHYGIARKLDSIGVTTGLAYTEFGGDLLDIEVLKFDGSGKIQITGKLGEVMKESAQAALSFIRSIAKDLKIDAKKFDKYDFHIHVPDGATPKDGPSAGVALCVSLASVLTKRPVRKDIAMTGEITLSGRVLEIGGLKEKLLAALRGKITSVLIPKSNVKDLDEMPKEVLESIKIKPISNILDAIKLSLV
jgi:ATP-dependent Lon protease